MVIQACDRRQRLRRATNAAHRRLDGLIDHAGLLNSRARYELYLHATWAARRPAEQALERAGIAGFYAGWPSRQVSDALSQDVFDVSKSRPADPTGEPSEILGTAESLGVLYVLEGSALGARVLGARAAGIGMTACFGARHLAHQISQPGAWAAFTDLLARTPMTDPEEDQCIAAAIATFEGYQRAFESFAPGG